MSLLTVAPQALAFVVSLADKIPEANDVKAGWVAFAIFLALLVAVGLLGWSLVRQLRKAQAAEEAGLYDPSDKKPRETTLPVDPPLEHPHRSAQQPAQQPTERTDDATDGPVAEG
jgi:hypothetical protein